MSPLTASLRRTLLMLFVFMAFVITLIYWNQTTEKPSTGSFNNVLSSSLLSNYEKYSQHNLRYLKHNKVDSSNEKIWTYKCINERCIRKHFLAENRNHKRVTFETCSMLCGPPNIWPQPSIKTVLGSKLLKFSSSSFKLNVDTKFENVKNLFQNAFEIFKEEVKNLEKPHHHGDKKDSSENNDENQHRKTLTHKNNNDVNIVNDISDNFVPLLATFTEQPHDVNNFEINIRVSTYSDTYLTLSTDESYNLTLTHSDKTLTVDIVAKSFFGARCGLVTLQQLTWYDDVVDSLLIIEKAYIEDAPKFNYRGLMLDTSRHYFSVDSIKRTLIGMAHSKLNRFHWHITDSQSFPFVSKYFPELAKYGAYSNNEVYTGDDVKDIVDFARVRGIQVIPEIDAPAHAANGWDFGVKKGLGLLSLCVNQQPWSYYCGEPPCGQLNPKNNNTYMILEKLYQELIELAGPMDFFHLGGDEVNLECWGQHFNDTDLRQLWCDFMQTAFQRVKKVNNEFPPKYTAVWSSGLTSSQCLSKELFAVQVWGGSTWSETSQLLDNGYHIIISHVDAWYLDCGFGSWRNTGEAACSPYRTWQNIYKHRPWDTMRLTQEKMKQVLGGEVCLWTEQVDEPLLDSRLWPRSSALAERLWTDPANSHDPEFLSQDVFSRMSVFRNRLIKLGIQAEPIFPKFCSQNTNECL